MDKPDWFGEDVAATYDEDTARLSEPEILDLQLDVLVSVWQKVGDEPT